jgi:hypothetical protein
MRLEAWRSDDAELPFYIRDIDGPKWAMSENEASRLSMAAQRAKWRLDRASRKKERPKAGAVFQRKLSAIDASAQAVVELGLAADGKIVAVYFEFAGQRIHLSGEQGPRFLALLARLGDALAELRQGQAAHAGGGQRSLSGFQLPNWARD